MIVLEKDGVKKEFNSINAAVKSLGLKYGLSDKNAKKFVEKNGFKIVHEDKKTPRQKGAKSNNGKKAVEILVNLASVIDTEALKEYEEKLFEVSHQVNATNAAEMIEQIAILNEKIEQAKTPKTTKKDIISFFEKLLDEVLTEKATEAK